MSDHEGPKTSPAADVEGPFWNYAGASNYAHGQRNMYATLCAEALLQVGGAKRARYWAAQFKQANDLCDRAMARYYATKDDEMVCWIGWNAQQTGRRP